jgi:hypothetical protein
MAFDSARGEVIVFGGFGMTGRLADTWAFASALNDPTISIQPINQSVSAGSPAVFAILATGSGTLSYQWRRNGATLSNSGHFSGVDSRSLVVFPVSATDTGTYDVVVSNACTIASQSAALSIVCPADFNRSGTVSVQDLFDFLATYFAGCP